MTAEDRPPPAGVRIGEWQVAVRDHPDSPSAALCHVLDRLSLRLDWAAGTGYASVAELAADAKCSERTVMNATRWALRNGLLVRTRRGHSLRNGKGVASQWRLTLPEFGTGPHGPVPESGTGTQGHLPESGTGSNRHLPDLEGAHGDLEGANQRLEPARRDAPSAFNTSTSQSSPPRRPELDARTALERHGATRGEIDFIIARMSNWPPKIRAALCAEDGPRLIEQARRELNGHDEGLL